jgi:hypothetical protein
MVFIFAPIVLDSIPGRRLQTINVRALKSTRTCFRDISTQKRLYFTPQLLIRSWSRLRSRELGSFWFASIKSRYFSNSHHFRHIAPLCARNFLRVTEAVLSGTLQLVPGAAGETFLFRLLF